MGDFPSHYLIALVFLSEISSTSASPLVKIAADVVSDVSSSLSNWLWSFNTPPPKIHIGRSMIKFEGGYVVETVFDGRKLGIEPYSIEVSPTGELIILDSVNSNIHKISSPLSENSRPKLLTGSLEGHTGHVDGKLREAKMHQPKGIAVDDGGNIYIADTMNMAIRKISDSGLVSTIAGGRMSRGAHLDGPSEDAKLSDDFDVTYVRSSCSLLVVDRGSQVIREIQLQYDDCNASEQPQSQDVEDNFNLGIAVAAQSITPMTGKKLIEQKLAAARAAKSSKPSPPAISRVYRAKRKVAPMEVERSLDSLAHFHLPEAVASASKLHHLELIDDIGVNAWIAFQDALSLKTRMKDISDKADKREVYFETKVEELQSRLSGAESRALEAERRLKEVQKFVTDMKEDHERMTLEHANEMVSQEKHIKMEYAQIARDVGAYFSLKARIEMMEEFQSGHHQSWSISNEVADLQMLYHDGQPGVDLLGPVGLQIEVGGDDKDVLTTRSRPSWPSNLMAQHVQWLFSPPTNLYSNKQGIVVDVLYFFNLGQRDNVPCLFILKRTLH